MVFALLQMQLAISAMVTEYYRLPCQFYDIGDLINEYWSQRITFNDHDVCEIVMDSVS